MVERSILSTVLELGAVMAVAAEVPKVKPLSRLDRIKLLKDALDQVRTAEFVDQVVGKEGMRRKMAQETRLVLRKTKHSQPRPSEQKTQIKIQREKDLVARVAGNSQVEAIKSEEIKVALLAGSLGEVQDLRRMSDSEIDKLWKERHGEIDPFLRFVCCRPAKEAISVLKDEGFGDLERYFDRRFELDQQVRAGKIAPKNAFDEISQFNTQADFEPTKITAPLVRDIATKFAFTFGK